MKRSNVLAIIIVIVAAIFIYQYSSFATFSIIDSSKDTYYYLSLKDGSGLKEGQCYKGTTITKISKYGQKIKASYKPGCSPCFPIYVVDNPDVTFYAVDADALAIKKAFTTLSPYSTLKVSYYKSEGTDGCKAIYNKDNSKKIKWIGKKPGSLCPGSDCCADSLNNTIYCPGFYNNAMQYIYDPALSLHEISHLFGLTDLYLYPFQGLYPNNLMTNNLRRIESWQKSDISMMIIVDKKIASGSYGLGCVPDSKIKSTFSFVSYLYDSKCNENLCESTGGFWMSIDNNKVCACELAVPIIEEAHKGLSVWETGKGCIFHKEIIFKGPPKRS